MNKQVLLYLRQSTPRIGGAEVVIRRTVSGLDPQQFEVVLVCFKKPGSDLSAIRASLEGVGSRYLEIDSSSLFDLSALRKVLALLREYPAAIVHCHDAKTDFFGFLLRWLRPQTKVVTTLHGWVVASRRGGIYKKLDQFFVRFFHAVIAVSARIQEEALACGIGQAQLIENGIDPDEWRLAAATKPLFPKEAGRWIGFLGRTSREKAPLDFIRVASLVYRQFPESRFVVAGDGPLLAEMKALARVEGLESVCLFLGPIALSEVPSFLRGLDLLCLTSETEGIPNVLLEAGAMGIPIVATAVGGVPRVVRQGQGGFTAPFGELDKLANHLLSLLRDEGLRARFAQEIRAWVVQEFSIHATVQKLVAIYETSGGVSPTSSQTPGRGSLLE